jgi:hypothetical protein
MHCSYLYIDILISEEIIHLYIDIMISYGMNISNKVDRQSEMRISEKEREILRKLRALGYDI